MILQRRKWLALVLVAVMLAAASSLLFHWQKPATALAAEDEAEARRTITVTGVGEITVEPDVAYVNFGVTTEGKTAEEAQSENAKIFANVNKVLFEQLKIDQKDVQTVGFHVHPEYAYPKGKEPVISGYSATHSIRVTCRELERIGELLDAVSKAGANQINSVQFATEKARQYEMEAMKEAMKNAREKAEVLAAAENQTIKGVVSIAQQSGNSGAYYRGATGYGLDIAASAESAGSSVNPGEIVITTQVHVTYEF